MADTRSETRKRFDTEFAAARKRGDKTFDFDGKKIAVKLADEMPKLSNEGQTMPKADMGQARLKNIPKLSNEGQTLPDSRFVSREEGMKDYVSRRKAVPTDESLSEGETTMKRGGSVKSSASRRADGIATKGHTRGRLI
jgi:hypothetical protein